MQRSTVVLPQPLGPSRQPIAPRASEKLKPAHDLLVAVGVAQVFDFEKHACDYSNNSHFR